MSHLILSETIDSLFKKSSTLRVAPQLGTANNCSFGPDYTSSGACARSQTSRRCP